MTEAAQKLLERCARAHTRWANSVAVPSAELAEALEVRVLRSAQGSHGAAAHHCPLQAQLRPRISPPANSNAAQAAATWLTLERVDEK